MPVNKKTKFFLTLALLVFGLLSSPQTFAQQTPPDYCTDNQSVPACQACDVCFREGLGEEAGCISNANTCSNAVSDPCFGVVCKSDEVCDRESSQCILKSVPEGDPNGAVCPNPGQADANCASGYCGTDQTCDDNPNRCVGVVCNPGFICNQSNGICSRFNNNLPIEDPNLPRPEPRSEWCNNDPNLIYDNGLCLPRDQVCTEDNFTCVDDLTDLIVKVVKVLLGLAGLVGVLFLIIGGYWYLASAGNEETAEKGKKTIINAIIGLVVIILAYTIVTIIANTLTK